MPASSARIASSPYHAVPLGDQGDAAGITGGVTSQRHPPDEGATTPTTLVVCSYDLELDDASPWSWCDVPRATTARGARTEAASLTASPSLAGSVVAAESGAIASTVDEVLGRLGSGRTPTNLEVDTHAEVQQVYDRLAQGGTPVDSTYPGKMVELEDGTRVGIREVSKLGGSTVDVFKPDGTHIKVHLP
jgi:hypothetical protein